MIANSAALLVASALLHRYVANEQWKAAYEAADTVDSLLGIKRRPTAVVALPGTFISVEVSA